MTPICTSPKSVLVKTSLRKSDKNLLLYFDLK